MIVLRNQLEVQATSYQLPAATSSYQDMLLLLAELNLLDVLEHCDGFSKIRRCEGIGWVSQGSCCTVGFTVNISVPSGNLT